MNKSVCQGCIATSGHTWNPSDDKRWRDDGIVICHFKTKGQRDWHLTDWSIDADDFPPRHCPYILEHLVMNQSLPEISKDEWIDSMDQKTWTKTSANDASIRTFSTHGMREMRVVGWMVTFGVLYLRWNSIGRSMASLAVADTSLNRLSWITTYHLVTHSEQRHLQAVLWWLW